ncbi:recombinase family protein, partial [Nitrosovibrio sp. Nv17]|uniref:recombinase family protein n=1 Tax=Nitrosovibrio sp. Nv17 TaxID=1855339 RepID=UPI000908CF7C
MNKATAIIYTRVSTLRQAEEGLPIESQIEQCHKRAAGLDASVLQVFCDAGISGRTDDRPGFQDAVAYCKTHHVDYFICWSTSRFARNKVDAAFHKLQLKKRGTRVVYVNIDLDSDTDSGWMMESMLEVIDEHFSRQISADTLRSMTKNARDGFFNGGRVPFGYSAVPEGKRKRLTILEDEAQIVREIFDLYVAGMGCKLIAVQLNESTRLRRDFKKWNKNLVAATLKNEVYTGKTIFNRTNHLTGKIRPRKNWIITQSHPAIIEEEIFMRTQELFEERAPSGNGGSPHSQ